MRSLCRTLFPGLIATLALGVLASAAAADTGSTAPTIAGVSASNVTEHDATLEAQIETSDLETTYEIWLEERVECKAEANTGCPVELEGEGAEYLVGHGQIAAGDSAQTVSADFTRLEANDYSYSYWVVATNSLGKTESPHQVLKPLPEGSAPPTDSTSSAATPSATTGVGPSGTASVSGGSGQSSSTPGVVAISLVSSLVSPLGRGKVLTKARRLSNALQACTHKPQKQRSDCQRQAKKAYGPAGKAKGSSRKSSR
jgi:hypothetical protein